MKVCQLCNSKVDDEIKCGEFLTQGAISVHTFCLYLSSGLTQSGKEKQGFFGFLHEDIEKERRRVQKLPCYYCRKSFANIGCCEHKCRKTFHLICGLENGAQNQFINDFRSFCNAHRRKRQEKPNQKEICCICYDPLKIEGRRNYSVDVIRAPCCRNGWFHKFCLQGYARSAGYFFKCPLCNDEKIFRKQMPYSGIFILDRDASWELEPHAFEELLQRPSRCEAEICKNTNGPDYTVDEDNPLIYCNTCGSIPMHKHCLRPNTCSYMCSVCVEIGRTNENGEQSGSRIVTEDEDEVDVCAFSDSDSDDASDTSEENNNFRNGFKSDKYKTTQTILDESDKDETINCESMKFIYSDDQNDAKHTDISPKNVASEVNTPLDTSDDEDVINLLSRRKIWSAAANRGRLHTILDESSNSSNTTIPTQQVLSPTKGEESDDDPLEDFSLLLVKKRKQLVTSNPNDDSSDTGGNKSEFINPVTNLKNDPKPTSSFEKKNNALEISVIANRTRRRKSQYYSEDTSSNSTAPSFHSACEEKNQTDTSFIGKRTRRRSTNLRLTCSESSASEGFNKQNLNSPSSCDSSEPLFQTPNGSNCSNTTKPQAKNLGNISSKYSTPICSPSIKPIKEASQLNISCIANRTRRRSDKFIQRTKCSESSGSESSDVYNSISSYSRCQDSTAASYSHENSSDSLRKNVKRANDSLEISCIAKRTRKHLDSKSDCDQKSTSENLIDAGNKVKRQRRSNTNSSLDDGFSSKSSECESRSSSSSDYKIFIAEEKRCKTLRLISTTSEEDYQNDDAMKIR